MNGNKNGVATESENKEK